MHIYPWQIAPPAIEHRCLEYCYTKPGIYSKMHIYLWQIDPTPFLQLSIDGKPVQQIHYIYIYIYISIYIYIYYIYIYSTMHIYLLQIVPTPSSKQA